MDWSSWISAGAAVSSALGGGFAYYQAQFSKKAKTDAAQEREMAERAEQRAIEVAEAAKLRLEAIDKQTAIFREQASQLEAIAKALGAGTLVADIGVTTSQHPSLEKRGPSMFALVNNRGSSPVEWCNRFVSFGVGYALSWSGVSSCWVGCGVSRDLVRMSRLR